MSTPISPMIASAMTVSTPGIVAEPVPDLNERGDQLVDADLEPGDGLIEVVEVGEDLAHDKRVVRPEAADQRRLQLGELGPQPPPGQLGEHLGVAGAGDERVEHVPPRTTQDVARHADDNFTPASWRTLSSRCASRVRSSIRVRR